MYQLMNQVKSLCIDFISLSLPPDDVKSLMSLNLFIICTASLVFSTHFLSTKLKIEKGEEPNEIKIHYQNKQSCQIQVLAATALNQ